MALPYRLSAVLGRRLLTCRCGDAVELHRHYRRGSDCAARHCSCRRFRWSPGRSPAGPPAPPTPRLRLVHPAPPG